MFALNTVVKSHKVLHNQDLMSIIGHYVVALRTDHSQSFKEVCRLWRHVYYTRLFNRLEFVRQRRAILLRKLAGNACFLSLQKGEFISLQDVDEILKTTEVASHITAFLGLFPSSSMSAGTYWLYSALIMPSANYIREREAFDFRINTSLASLQQRISDCLCRMILINASLNEIIAYLCGKLDQVSLETVYTRVLKHDKCRAHLLFPYMKVTLEVFSAYVYAFHETSVNRPVITRGEALFRALARDIYVDHYVKVLEINGFPWNNQNFCDAFVRVGADIDGFARELFQSLPHGQPCSAMSIRFIMLGTINPCSRDRYKFARKGVGRATIFEFASHEGDRPLFNFVTQDPRFKPSEHLDILAYGPRVNMHRISIDFLKYCKLDKEELEQGLAIVNEALAKTKRKNVSSYAIVIRKLNKYIAREGARKKVKLTVKVGEEVVAPRS